MQAYNQRQNVVHNAQVKRGERVTQVGSLFVLFVKNLIVVLTLEKSSTFPNAINPFQPNHPCGVSFNYFPEEDESPLPLPLWGHTSLGVTINHPWYPKR